jgi:putative transcription factor
MQCELCGAKIRGPSRTVRIEGAELEVCAQCAKYGTEVQKPRKAAPGRAVSAPSARAPARKRRDVFDFMEGEIVENYGVKIRDARMERGWSQKDLAMEMKEKELLIKKIEKEDLIPEDDVRIKIEKTLGIRLIDTAEEEEESRRKSRIVPTMGDVISIKKVRK